jgi:CheY-like chemotaxis protein
MEPPLKVLAADDDELCRKAVGFALEKAGLAADFAENGQQALEMATAAAYDMVFLDIQMPEMDGLTACTKIRETKKNAQTPVVFVTVQTDFLTRAQTTAMGSEFIAKPFLVFEITMKAIICAVRKRLALLPRDATGGYCAPNTAASAVSTDGQGRVARKSRSITAEEDAHLKQSFFNEAPAYLAGIADLLDDISVIADDQERKSATSDLHLRLLTLHTAAKENDLTVASRVASAVEALARKMDTAARNVTPSTLRTMSAGVRLLDQLCVPDADFCLSRALPVRLLVVEDEPLARRAVVGALQLAFERPDSANDGAAALAMAAQRQYDVIFSDIEMPGMDGFELCRRLRADGLNSNTPIVFITSHADAASRIQAAEVGGTDFISKPFLPVEITVKALTLAYERQLDYVRTANTQTVVM